MRQITVMAIQNIIDEKKYTFQLIKGYTQKRRPFYAFMIFNLARFKQLKRESNGWVDLRKEGILVLGGKGHEVSDQIKAKALRIFHTEYLKEDA